MKRNWIPPKAKKVEGKPTSCKHPETDDYVWHEVAVSPSEGRPALGHIVTRAKVTRTCKTCKGVGTEILDILQPTEDDLHKFHKGKAPTKVIQRLRAIVDLDQRYKERKATVNAEEPEEDPDEPVGAAPTVAEDDDLEGPPIEDEAKDEAGPSHAQASPIEASMVEPVVPEPVAPKLLGKDFWKSLETVKRVKNFQRFGTVSPAPFKSPTDLFNALMKDVHEVTKRHSLEHLIAKVGTVSGVLMPKESDIKDFVMFFRGVGPLIDNPAQRKLMVDWQLMVTDTNEAYFPIGSMLAILLFDTWLEVPRGELWYPELDAGPKWLPYWEVDATAAKGTKKEIDMDLASVKAAALAAVQLWNDALAVPQPRQDEVQEEAPVVPASLTAEELEMYAGTSESEVSTFKPPLSSATSLEVHQLASGHEGILDIAGKRIVLTNMTGRSITIKALPGGKGEVIVILGAV